MDERTLRRLLVIGASALVRQATRRELPAASPGLPQMTLGIRVRSRVRVIWRRTRPPTRRYILPWAGRSLYCRLSLSCGRALGHDCHHPIAPSLNTTQGIHVMVRGFSRHPMSAWSVRTAVAIRPSGFGDQWPARALQSTSVDWLRDWRLWVHRLLQLDWFRNWIRCARWWSHRRRGERSVRDIGADHGAI
jgi:hypothetical protein